MEVSYSPLDANRFGYRIARASLSDATELVELVAALDAFDIVILRVDEDPHFLAFELSRVDGWNTYTADHLMYWTWSSNELPDIALPDGLSIVRLRSDEQIDDLVRSSFSGYRNHYSANPLLHAIDATEGYVEWTRSLHAEDHGSISVMRSPEGENLGFGLIDWSIETPDVRLAAMHPMVQGQGLYAHLLRSICRQAGQRGSSLQISTQSTNVNVMRVWARLGFLPSRTTVTYHLVRATLLADSP